MDESLRTGINERWAKGWKTALRDRDAWYAIESVRQEASLHHYVAFGRRKPSPHVEDMPDEPVIPPSGSWENAYVQGDLRIYAALQQWKWERAAIEDGRFDAQALATMLAADELAELIALDVHALFPQRYPGGGTLRSMDPKGFCYSALGLVGGPKLASLDLARMQVEAFRRGLYDKSVFRPTQAFLARLFADWQGRSSFALTGDPKPLLKGELAADPVLGKLLEVWRDPDPVRIAGAGLAALDIHTYLASPGPKSYRREFIGAWSRTPIAVLLVFRLRQLLGLQNPSLEHPLMDGVIGSLQHESSSVPDPIIAAVRQRMEQDGFAVDRIRKDYLAGDPQERT